jgi:hypothetical protein
VALAVEVGEVRSSPTVKGYTIKDAAQDGIAAVKRDAAGADVKELSAEMF